MCSKRIVLPEFLKMEVMKIFIILIFRCCMKIMSNEFFTFVDEFGTVQ